MAVNNNIFTMKAVNDETTSDLYSQLGTLIGVSKGTDGKYHLADICQSPAINMWAKKKGFGYNSENFDYDPMNPDPSNARRAAARKEKNQGFDLSRAKIGSNGNLAGIDGKYGEGINGWTYLAPRGRAYNEPFRLRDFDGYNHAALPFIGGFSAPSRWAKDLGAFTVAFRVSQVDTASDDISYLDIPAVANAYVGVALMAQDGSIMRMTADDTINNVGISLNVPTNNLAVGTYTLYPFFSTKKLSFTDGDIIVSEQFTVPNCNPITMVLAQATIVVVIRAEYLFSVNTTTHALEYRITITNSSGGAVTLENNFVRLRYADKKWNDIMLNDEKENEIGTITLAAGASTVISGAFLGISESLYKSSRIWVSLETGAYQSNAIPMQQMQPDLPDLTTL